MRRCFREQLRRREGRFISANPFWRGSIGIEVPWTRGQRAWVKKKISAAMEGVFRQREFFISPAHQQIVVSADFYTAYREALEKKNEL